jgi:hypothetical protein
VIDPEAITSNPGYISAVVVCCDASKPAQQRQLAQEGTCMPGLPLAVVATSDLPVAQQLGSQGLAQHCLCQKAYTASHLYTITRADSNMWYVQQEEMHQGAALLEM